MNGSVRKSPADARHGDRKKAFTQTAILDAAETLLRRDGYDDFSMRELAQEAGMAVTTPFAQFGSKNGVLRGLLDRFIDRIQTLYDAGRPGSDAIDRLFQMAEAGVDYLLEDPAFSRRVCASLLAPTGDTSHQGFRRTAEDLWVHAVGDDIAPFTLERREFLAGLIPQQLMMSFRGALALWIAEDLPDAQLGPAVTNSVVIILLAFAPATESDRLFARLVAMD